MDSLHVLFAKSGSVQSDPFAWLSAAAESSGPDTLAQVVQALLHCADAEGVQQLDPALSAAASLDFDPATKACVGQGVILAWGLVSQSADSADKLRKVSRAAVRLCEAVCPDFLLTGLPDELLRLAGVKGAPDKKSLLKAGTSRFYKQSKFNLMAECSEGFAKAFLEMHTQQPHDAAVGHIQALCGRFQLDGNRLLEMALNAAETQVSDLMAHEGTSQKDFDFVAGAVQRAAFFGGIARLSAAAGHFEAVSALFQADNLPHLLGARLSAHAHMAPVDGNPSLILQTPDEGSLPGSSAVLCALLLSRGTVTLEALLPHILSCGHPGLASQQVLQHVQSACDSYSVATLSASNGAVGAGAVDVESRLHLTPSQAVNGAIAGPSSTTAFGSLAGSGVTSAAFSAFCGGSKSSSTLDSVMRAAQKGKHALVALACATFSLAAAAVRTEPAAANAGSGSAASEEGAPKAGALSPESSAFKLLELGMNCLNVFFAEGGCHVSLCPPLVSSILQVAESLVQLHSAHGFPAGSTITELMPLLLILGPALASAPPLFSRLLDLLNAAHTGSALPTVSVDGEHPAAKQARIATTDSYLFTALQHVFLPALTCAGNNKFICLKVWSMLAHLPWSVRYALYSSLQQSSYAGEDAPVAWHLAALSSLPSGCGSVGLGSSMLPKLAGLRAEQFTRQALKRVAADTVRRAGQQFGKTAAGNALILFSTLLTQLSQYDNLIAMVAEQCLESLTPMAVDQGMFCITQHLSIERPCLQADGVTVQSWLSALSSLVGAFLTKFPTADVSGFLFCCTRQLLQKSIQPVWPMQAILQQAIGVNSVTDIADSAVDALAGSARLVHVLGMFKSSQATALDLGSLHSAFGLQAASFAESPVSCLTVLVLQLAVDTIYGESSQALPLKVIGVRFDRVTQLAQQLLEYSRLHTPSVACLQARLPNYADLFSSLSLSPANAWALLRPLVRSVTYPAGICTLAAEQIPSARSQGETAKTPAGPWDSVEDSLGVWGSEPSRALVDGDWSHSLHVFSAKGLVHFVQEHLKPTLPPLQLTGANRHVQEAGDTCLWEVLSPILYSLFWAHEPCDLFCPVEAYGRAMTSIQSERQDIVSELQRDLRVHQDHTAQVAKAFELHNSLLVPRNTRNRVWYFFTQVCTLPRATISAGDALYAATFLHKLHRMDVENLSSLRMFNQTLLCVTPVLSSCTENEAVNLGIFLRELLAPIVFLTTGSTFEVERKCRQGWRKGFKDEEPIDKEQFFSVLGAWDERLGSVFRAMLETGEHSHVKNSILVLRRLHCLFPFAQNEATKVLQCVAQVRDEDARQDLQTLARGYHGMLSQRAPALPLTMRLADRVASKKNSAERSRSESGSYRQDSEAAAAPRQRSRDMPEQASRQDRSNSRPPPPSRPPGRSPSRGNSGLSVKRARSGQHGQEARHVSRRSEGRSAPGVTRR